MKKLIALFLICSLLTGCANLKGTGSLSGSSSPTPAESISDTEESVGTDENNSYMIYYNGGSIMVDMFEAPPVLKDEWVTIDDVTAPDPVAPVVFDNGREDYTDEEAAKCFEQFDNFTVSEDFYAEVPKHLDHVSYMITDYPNTSASLSNEEQLKDFLEAFKYIFPDKEFDPELMYLAATNGIYKLLYKHYDEFANKAYCDWEPYNNFPSFMYGDANFRTKHPLKDGLVGLYGRYPFGIGGCAFNRGVADKMAYDKDPDKEISYAGDIFNPSRGFEYVETLRPDSDKVYKLLDKEISVKDAVKFYEDYINTFPCKSPSPFRAKVNRVEVYKLTDDSYGYYYYCSKEYDEVPFEGMGSGQHTNGFFPTADLSNGFMALSDEVDYSHSLLRGEIILEEKQYTNFLPFDEAVKMLHEKMSAHLEFEVTDTELVYVPTEGIRDNETVYPAYPAWRFALFNKNDDLYYVCYLNVLDKEDLKYYTAKHIV